MIDCKSLTSELAAQINEHHRLAYRYATKAIEHARQAGELLIKAKFEIPHGGWLPWLEANCDVGEREAQRYMRLSRRWDELKSDTVFRFFHIQADCGRAVGSPIDKRRGAAADSATG